MITLGIFLLFTFFLGLWAWLARCEHQIKKRLKKISVFLKKLQTHQFYLTNLFKLFHLKVPPSWVFGLPLIGGAFILVISSWIFGVIAEDIISRDPLTLADDYINRWFYFRTSPSLTKFMVIISDLASFNAMIILYLFLILILAWKRIWYGLVFLSLSIPGGMLLNHIMKVAFHRPRPLLHQFFVSSLDYSFPSGHVMNATLLYGIMAIFTVQIIKEWKWQVFVILFATLFILLVALSRIYLGYHYLSDTLAAIAISLAWLSLCFMATMALKQVKRNN
jgi:undecaprenyl-diphosphatase